MNKFKKILVAAAIAAVGAGTMIPAQSFAKEVCQTGTNKGKVVENGECGDDKANETGTTLIDRVKTVITIILSVLGIVAVAVIILGGIQYTMSTGDAAKTKQARYTIMYGIIGLVVASLAYVIVNFVLQSIGGSATADDDSDSDSASLFLEISA